MRMVMNVCLEELEESSCSLHEGTVLIFALRDRGKLLVVG
jgi:hypothetical protein